MAPTSGATGPCGWPPRPSRRWEPAFPRPRRGPRRRPWPCGVPRRSFPEVRERRGTMRAPMIVGGLALAVALGWPGAPPADVIPLVNGSQIQVEAWRDVGDAIEFQSGGGIVRIAKSEVRKIDGRPTRGQLSMYSSGSSETAAAPTATGSGRPADQAAAVKRMTDLLEEGEALFTQTALTSTEEAIAFRRLGAPWSGVDPPQALRGA